MNPVTHSPLRDAARIVLVRHGRSAHRDDGGWISSARVPDYERRYDAAGLLDGDLPPAELVEIARRADTLASSDLPRAIESARAWYLAGIRTSCRCSAKSHSSHSPGSGLRFQSQHGTLSRSLDGRSG